jgi:hypothetical protein|tara:strand:- start:94 stop:804 length:711 start_codon:yes stop_codon:yes gene_type:complete
MKKINVATFNWGPCVVKFKMEDDFKKLLLDEAKKNVLDFKDKLAGILDHETGYSEESKQKILPFLSHYLGAYDEVFQKYVNKVYTKKPEYILSALWCNFQRPNEFNPPHDHDGKLSFVSYLSIPDALKEENKNYVGKSCGPGGIQFIYGNGPRDCISYQSFFPEEGDMFIFPAWLKHWVSPYKSNVIRISVSGNIHDSAPLNNITNFAPEYLKKVKREKDASEENEKYLDELKKKL